MRPLTEIGKCYSFKKILTSVNKKRNDGKADIEKYSLGISTSVKVKVSLVEYLPADIFSQN